MSAKILVVDDIAPNVKLLEAKGIGIFDPQMGVIVPSDPTDEYWNMDEDDEDLDDDDEEGDDADYDDADEDDDENKG